MSRNTINFAWFLAVIAVLAWAGVGFFAYQIGALENARAADMRSSQQRSQQSVQASYLHGIVSSSATDRAQLDTLISVDPASLADMIDSAGTQAGVSLTISNASAENISSVDGKTTAQGFSFLATSQGEFASAMQAAALLESLPIPSSVQAIRLSHTQTSPGTTGAGAVWQMNAQVQILSASNVSS
jgi:hypothetical protein